jgi:Bifunctional DNA primase/polymerase, N-terminal
MQEILNRLPAKDAALLYARSGWSVFPLAGKIPYEFLLSGQKGHGHRDATTDRAQIAAWWSEHPKANIGLATGRESGLLVLDMDVPQGYFGLKELQQEHGALPPTRTVHTASGGLHLYFHYPQDGFTYPNTVGLAEKIGVDVRSEGGYVVLPPSKLYGRLTYSWATADTPIAPLPDWLQSLLPKRVNTRGSRTTCASRPRRARSGLTSQ